jgi:hypothetical protein
MKEPQASYPAEGIDHFKHYLDNIRSRALEFPHEPSVWTSVDIIANELDHSIHQGKVSPEEAEGIRQEMASFMAEGGNRINYETCLKELKERPSFWWEKEGGEDSRPQS